MAVVTEPGVAVLSGPLLSRSDCVRALGGAGFACAQVGTPPGDPHHGLPSHPDPDLAAEAGAPNAGHTPGTPHPDTGDPYVGDPNVGWVDVPLSPPDILDRVVELAQTASYVLRCHSAELVTTIPDLTVEQHLATIDEHLAAIHAMRGQ